MKGILFCFILIISGTSAFAISEENCIVQITSIAKSIKKLRPAFMQSLEEVIREPEVRIKDLKSILRSLKEEEEIFLDTYTNRSKRKRKLTPREASELALRFGWNTSEVEIVQTLYSNEIKRLIILADKFFRNALTDLHLDYFGLKVDKNQRRLLSTGLFFINKNPSYPAEVVGEEASSALYESFGFYNRDDFYLIAGSNRMGSINWSELEQTEIGNQIGAWKAVYENPNSFFCCFVPKNGHNRCTMCPFRNKL